MLSPFTALAALDAGSTSAPTANAGMGTLDLAIIIVYIVGIVAYGMWAGIKANKPSTAGGDEADNYFLAGNNLKWPVIGLALFATNISTIHIVSLAESGYLTGLTQGNFELGAGICLAILAIFFAPFFIRSKVATLPDFLEKRYSPASRDLLTIISIISAVLIHIGFTLYIGASVINGLFGLEIPLATSIIILAALTGVYTIVGGLTAVVVTESVQTIIMLIGTILITVIGYNMVGGWEGITSSVPEEHMTMFADDFQGGDKLRWYSFVPGYLIIGIWYWCTDQTIVQRVLAARDENQARLGALFAGFLKILPLFIIVLPGVIFLALVQQDQITLGSDFQSKDTYILLIKETLPAGLKGLLAATLLSAAMSTVSGALNSIATLVSFDLVKRRQPDASQKKLVLIGRITAALALLLAVLWSTKLNPDGIFTAMQGVIVNIAPPITAVFLFGVFWKKSSARGALLTLTLGSLLGITMFLIGQNFFMDPASVGIASSWNDLLAANSLDYMLVGVIHFIACCLLMVIGSLTSPHQHSDVSRTLTWDNPLQAFQGTAAFKLLTVALIIAVALIYALLW